MNPRAVLCILGTIAIFNSIVLLVPIIWAILYNDGGEISLAISSALSFCIGFPLWFLFKKHRDIQLKDGFIVITLGWALVSALSALPFVMEGAIPSFTDAFFEMMSGYTTTGASILNDIEALPHSLLFLRSFTHFIGGMGILMIAILILPLIGIGGLQLYKAEAAPGQGPSNEKIFPRIKESVRWLWGIYIFLNMAVIFLYWTGGMTFFDAICHAFSTVSTSGYSTKNASFAAFDSSYIQWVTIIFMFLGGMNFFLFYSVFKSDWSNLFKNTELRLYIFVVVSFSLLAGGSLYLNGNYSPLDSLRHGAFQVVSLLTTTGYTTTDYTLWPQAAQMVLFLCLFSGACAGSTSSGIKIVQMAILWKYLYTKVQRLLQPLAIIPIRINGGQVEPTSIGNTLGFFILNIFFVFWGGALMAFISDLDFFTAFISVVATAWNIGPAFGSIGPAENYYHISDAGKWFLSFAMLAGRLDMFTVLVMFYPSFWKK